MYVTKQNKHEKNVMAQVHVLKRPVWFQTLRKWAFVAARSCGGFWKGFWKLKGGKH